MSEGEKIAARPLIYSCSGCSSAAQMTNYLALQLHRRGLAEMSCIAGVGGDVPALVRTARQGRPIIALDGCPLHCVLACLGRQGIRPERHYTLTELGVRKRPRDDFDLAEAEALLPRLEADVEELLACSSRH